MIRILGALACWLGIHVAYSHTDRRWSIYWACSRCGQLQRGSMIK